MEAVFYDHFRTKPWMQEIDLPTLEGQSVLLQIKASGLCRSDWHGWMGHDPDIRLPHVPGHEFSGVIVEVGTDVRRWRKGQRVTAPFIQACGTCSCCQRNDQQVCINQEQAGFSYWGSFAPHMVLRYADQNLVSVPDNVSFEAAALLGCRFGTAFRAICRQAQVVRGQSVIIFGAGGLGLSALLICKALGSKVCVVDPNEDAIRFATQLGADLSVTNWSLEHKSLVREWSEGGVHVSLDAVG
ncbi:MAG: alcohol dehydrogenase catalytic domain-containing protein, partial [Saprospiraceae bacterium]|nr:alcohol dehydrogenase catalytic domain-containing protein [Saprospiraceae bacterium]